MLGPSPPRPYHTCCIPGSSDGHCDKGLQAHSPEEHTEAAGSKRPFLPQHRCGSPKLHLGHRELEAQVHNLGTKGERGQRVQSHKGAFSWPPAATQPLTDLGVCGAPDVPGPAQSTGSKHGINETDQVSALGNPHRPGEQVNNNQSNQMRSLQRVTSVNRAEQVRKVGQEVGCGVSPPSSQPHQPS